MAKITLIRPPCVLSAGSISGGLLTPPIALAYLAASVRNSGHEVSIIDAIGLDPEKKTYLRDKLYLVGTSFSDILNLIPEDVNLIGISSLNKDLNFLLVSLLYSNFH